MRTLPLESPGRSRPPPTAGEARTRGAPPRRARARRRPTAGSNPREIERAHRESRGVARQHGDHRPRDQDAQHRAGAAEHQALGEQRPPQGAGPAPSAARIASSPSRRTERARIRFATFEHAMTNTSADAASSTSSTVRAGDVIWSRSRTASMRKSPSPEYDSGMLLDHRRLHRSQFRARRFEVDARREPAEELGHPVHPSVHHRCRQVMRAGDDVGDDLRFGRIRHRGFEHADDRGGRDCRAARSCRGPPVALAARCVQKRYVSTTRPAAFGPSSLGSISRPRTGFKPITSK